jgi:hypothetical protein
LITQQELQAFEAAVIADDKHSELICGKYIKYAAQLLLPGTATSIETIQEDRNFFGSSDIIISATVRDGLNKEQSYVYIWELKSPQNFLLEKDDNKNRFRPTKEYLKAENQLLHYFYEASESGSFRQRYRVIDRSNIKMGGIIMGRSNDRLARGIVGGADEENARRALALREYYLYGQYGIRVLTWDSILSFLR